MLKHTCLLRPTISKSLGADKNAAWRWLAGWLMSMVALLPHAALALPATIAWEVPLDSDETYFLEVADSPGFAKPLLTTAVKGTGYLWQAPAEGVYHWRLTRPGQKVQAEEGVEISYLASGSFATLDPTVQRQQAARLVWEPVAGADRYKIYVLDADNKQRIMTVTTTFLVLPKTEVATMFEVVPFTDEHRASRAYHLDPSLKLISGVPPAPPVVVAPPPPPAPPPVVKTTLLIGDQTDPHRRRHAAYLFLSGVQESLHLQKLAVDVQSKTQQLGGGVGMWLNPAYGLVISGAADYHEHVDRGLTQPAIFPNQRLTIDESRYSADLSVGYNILDFFGIERFLCVLAGSAAITQLPLLPRGYVPTPGSPLQLDKERLTLLGGSGSIGYLGTAFSAVIEGGGLAENTTDGRYTYGRILLEAYPVDRLAVSVGAFVRNQEATSCASAPAACLFYGASHTVAQETALILGVGSVLR